jgi:hypothetical protein
MYMVRLYYSLHLFSPIQPTSVISDSLHHSTSFPPPPSPISTHLSLLPPFILIMLHSFISLHFYSLSCLHHPYELHTPPATNAITSTVFRPRCFACGPPSTIRILLPESSLPSAYNPDFVYSSSPGIFIAFGLHFLSRNLHCLRLTARTPVPESSPPSVCTPHRAPTRALRIPYRSCTGLAAFHPTSRSSCT